jgi:ABC-type phosphate/phosphonate transport system substrate-binding protein
MRFIHDSNLGFPIGQEIWQDFFTRAQCAVFGTTNIEQIGQSLENDSNIFAYIPVVCLYEKRKIQEIKGLVSATTGKSGSSTTSSVLIIKRGANIKNLSDLRGKTYGRINQYCTSSYFAPAIHLSDNGFHFQDFFGAVKDIPVSPGNWQNQIDQVISGAIDATMVDENTWLAKSKNSEETEIIGRMDGLPCPIIVSKSILNNQFLDSYRDMLLVSPRDTSMMFSGFIPYAEDSIDAFFKRISNAFAKA